MSPQPGKSVLTPKIVSDLSTISDGKTRQAFLAKQKLLSANFVTELNDATLKEFRVNTARALSLAEAAILIARRVRKNELLAQSYRVKANVLAAAGDYQASAELYDASLKLFDKTKNQEGIGRTLTASIQPHIMLGSYDRAFAAAERARKIFVRLGDSRRLARLENNIGNIYHRQDRFEEALTHYERGYRRLLPYGDSEELTISLNNMSMCLISMNNFGQALATYQRAKEVLATRDLPLIRLITDYNVAYLYYLRGDYRRAIEMLKNARVEAERIDYTYLVALCYLDLSDIYVELNLSAEARDVAEQGYLLFRRLEIGYEAAKTLANQAIASGQDGKTRRALELFGEAKPLFEKENNQVWPWLIDLYQAVVLFREGRHYEARRLASAAAQFFDGSFLKNKAALCHLLLAQIAVRVGDSRAARSECSAALDLLAAIDSPILSYQGHFLLGQIEHEDRNFDAAYAEYQQARAGLEGLRSSLGRDELKISFMKNKTELYERLVSLCLEEAFEAKSCEEAFRYIELAKSRSLVELIFQRGHALPEEKPGQSELVHKIRDLREELNWYQHRIELEQLRSEHNSPERIEHLRLAAQEREKTLLGVLSELPSAEAEHAAMPGHEQSSLANIRLSLGEDTTLLEYFSTDDQILAVVVTKNSLEITPVTTVARVSEALRLLHFQFGKLRLNSTQTQSAGSTAQNNYQATVSHLNELYIELVAPLRSRLTTTNLVIVPHGLLHYLPFHALHDGAAFLLDSYSISYAPSAAIHALCHATTSGAAEAGSLVLGVSDAQAPLIKDEVESIHRALHGSELFLGEAVTHQLLADKAKSCQIVHIATHGVFRPDNPMFSGIRLGDGYLHLYELYQMNLGVELLTLSGCATGLNVVAAGDELLGLIRGALYAGAKSLLLTLWDVNDHSTAEFMKSFYGHLPEATSKADALSVAAKEVRENHPHPYYWAPFMLVGKRLSMN